MTPQSMFLFAAAALVIVVGIVLVRPLWSSRVSAARPEDSTEAQRASLREANATIESDLAAGAITQAQADVRRSELLARARAEDVALERSASSAESPRQVAAAIACVLAALCVGVAIYAVTGKNEGLTAAKRSAPAQAPQVGPEQITQMVARLESRLNAEPPKAEDLPQWKMLARSHIMLGDVPKAVTTLRTVLALSGPTAENETNLAEALLAQREGKPNPEIEALLKSAYAKTPTDQKVLWLNAAVAQERGDKPAAVKFLSELLPTVAADSQEAADIKRFVAELSK